MVATLDNNYIIFQVKDLLCAVNCLDVQEIIREKDKVTKISGAEEYIDGVLNLRGNIVTIIDLSVYFNLEKSESEDEALIIINDEEEKIGAKISKIIDVVDSSKINIENTPAIPHDLDPIYIENVMQIDNEIVTILDIKAILQVSNGEKEV